MPTLETMPELPMRTVTCRTPSCENADIPITLPCAELVLCGACAVEITDIQEA